MAIKSYDEYLNEGKPIADTPNLALGKNPINKPPKNPGKLQIGDDVIDTTSQWKGVGAISQFRPNGKVMVDWYDDSWKSDTYGMHDIGYSKLSNLIPIAATEDNYSYTDEAAISLSGTGGGAVSSNTKGQETGKLKPADKDDEDPYNPSIINKFAATVAGGNVAFVSKNKSTPGRGISTKRGVKEGGLGDHLAAGQPIFTQTVDKSKQGYQDAMYYEEDDDENNEIGVIDEQLLDDAVYSTKKRNHKDPELNLDELPLFDPPKNSSDESKRELLYLSMLPQPSKFDLDQDKNFSDTFSKFLKSKGFDINKQEIHGYSDRIKAIIAMVKNHYNRPRPEQLAKYLNIDIKPTDSATASTPSYPSGHAAQPFAIATALSYKYPNLSNDLFRLADEIATSRLRMRLHYPSDYEYGKRLGLYIGQKLKMK